MTRKNFTLIELVVVCAVIALASGLGTAAMRRSGKRQLDEAAQGFLSFCAGVRMQAMELGRDRVVYFREETREFYSGDPRELPLPREEEAVFLAGVPEELRSDEDLAMGLFARPEAAPELKWSIPEDFRMQEGLDEAFSEDAVSGSEAGEKEVFRFFPDGGASGKLRFALYGKESAARTFALSPLTGKLTVEERDK